MLAVSRPMVTSTTPHGIHVAQNDPVPLDASGLCHPLEKKVSPDPIQEGLVLLRSPAGAAVATTPESGLGALQVFEELRRRAYTLP